MLGVALLASIAATAGSIGSPTWLDPQRSFGHLTAFHVRVDLHGSEPEGAVLSAEAVEKQIATTLRSSGIEVVDERPDQAAALHGMGVLVVDVHVLARTSSTVVAWSLHASQIARVLSGAWAFASTWEVGDLVEAPPGTAQDRLRASLQPALDEFCSAYLASRPAPRGGERPAPGPGVREQDPAGTSL